MYPRQPSPAGIFPDDAAQAALRAEAAKLGINLKLDDIPYQGTRQQMLTARAEVRRVVDQLRGRARQLIEAHRESEAEPVLQAIDAAADIIGNLSVRIDIQDAVEAEGQPHSRAAAADVVRVDGRPTRILRSAADYRAHYGAAAGFDARREPIGLADFIRGVAGLRTTPDVQAALSVGTDSAGGFSVPSQVMPQILEAMAPASAVLSAGAGILPLEDGAKAYTQVIVDTIPAAAWRAEAGSIVESDPAFRGVVVTPRSLAFRFKVSRELLMDGVGIEQALTTVIAQAFAKELDRVALRGTGTAPEPRGILNTTNVAAITNGANGQAQSSLRWSNLLTAVQTILAYDAPAPTAAIMAPRSLVGYAALSDTTNQPLGRPDLLREVRFLASSQVPVNLTVGASADCTEVYVGDFTKVVFAMREQASIQKLSELYAESGQIGFVGHVRADVAVLYPRAFAVITGVRPG